ncbi:MAG: biosynthetic arginine decarboxylase [Pseudomonadota bacterium]
MPLNDAYNIQFWGDGYFQISSNGELCVVGEATHSDEKRFTGRMPLLAQKLEEQGLRWPVLVRFHHILRDRVHSLSNAFNKVMLAQNYQAPYFNVYPIKVNQQRRVVEEIVGCHNPEQGMRVGLEAGSKAELFAVLASAPRHDSVIICNGYKDREYLRMALWGRKLGLNIFIVIEKDNELRWVLEEAEALNVKPQLGIRVRLNTLGAGKWQNTGGEKSKFGLSPQQMLRSIKRLREHNSLDQLQLLHFHMGSQISNAEDIQRCMAEATQYFVELSKLGVPLKWIDVGGGLGIDYEGTRSRQFCSINYSLEEYAHHIVHSIKSACDQANLSYPNIVTEAGRALTAHHAVLLAPVMEIERPPVLELNQKTDSAHSHAAIQDLLTIQEQLKSAPDSRNLVEIYHRVTYLREQLCQQFSQGLVRLEDFAQGEQLYYTCCVSMHKWLSPIIRAHQVLHNDLNEKLAEKLFINFSVFQSMPDVWGINQIFPIVPLKGLHEPLTRRGTIQDITCDSDGRIDEYVDGMGIESSLPIPENFAEHDLLGFFLVGAYQEILGDLHNLFGDTDSIDVQLIGEDQFELQGMLQGDTVDSVLDYVNYDTDILMQELQSRFDAAHLSAEEASQGMHEFNQALMGYTFLEETRS